MGRGVSILALMSLSWMAFASPTLGRPIHTQSITLEPGWNAIYLEVTPESPDIPSVFAGLPILSLWHRDPRTGRVEFIDDPGDGLLDRPGWRSFFPDVPDGTPFLTNLFALRGNQAYLVRLGGSESVQLSLRGKPSLRPIRWTPDAFNLVGFHLDPLSPPTASDFFSASPAHAGQPVYTLESDGFWRLMSPGETLQPGRSYWVLTTGKSEFQGPLEVLAPTQAGLEFGSAITTLDLSFRNHASAARDLRLELLPSDDGSSLPVLAHWELDPDGNTVWPELPSPFELGIVGGGLRNTPLAVRRAEISTGTVAGLLAVTDGAGSRWLVPVSAASSEAGVAALSGTLEGTPKDSGGTFTGLWVGSATVDRVSEIRRNVQRLCPCPASGFCPAAVDGSIGACEQDADGGLFCKTGPDTECELVERGTEDPIPARREFDLRLLIHCDDSGNAKLLKEVTLMFEEGEDENTPGSFVLVVNDERFADFTGSALRDGVPVGTRVSSAAFDFPGTSLPLSGSVAPGQTLEGTITLAPTFPTNPFRHQFHPDHNQLDEQFQPFEGASRSRLFEEFTITRQLTFELAAADPETEPLAGDSLLVGTFRETISGLHRQDVFVEGTLRLQRLSAIASLQE